MKVVLALGNPGARYAETRHNIGWIVADTVAARLNTQFRPAKGDYYEARGEWQGQTVVLVKPTTFMNNSGIAARQVLERYGVPLSDMLVVVDEIQFPVGRAQIRPSGSSGGHNGMESLIYHLDSVQFPRLRCGVGRDFGPGGMADYVLSRFPAQEETVVAAMLADACDITLVWIADGIARAMDRSRAAAGNEPRHDDTPSRGTADSDRKP